MTVAQGTPNELQWLMSHCRAIGMKRHSLSGLPEHDVALFTVELKDRAEKAEREVAALSAQVVEYQKELGIRQNMTPTTRLNNICKALEEQKNDSPYSAESWDTLVAENDGLRAQVVELQQDAERMDWLDGEGKREAEWYCTDKATRGPNPIPLYRRNVPITRDLIDAAKAGS